MTLPVDGIKLHRGNFAAIGQQIQPLLDAGQCFRLQVKPWREKRSLLQNALSHMWYTEISEYLISSGRTDATPEWVIRRGHRYTDKECDGLLNADLRKVANAIDPLIKVRIPEPTRAALYSFTYNVGSGAFSSSTLLKKLNAGDVPGACKELQRWTYAGGKQWKGLISRREVEREVCEWGQK